MAIISESGKVIIPEVLHDQTEEQAHRIWEGRVRKGLRGDQQSDWERAATIVEHTRTFKVVEPEKPNALRTVVDFLFPIKRNNNSY